MLTYPHDCEGCVYKETFELNGHTYDAYHCPGNDGPEGTLLARYGEKPSAYWSMAVDVMKYSRAQNFSNCLSGPSPVFLAMLDRMDTYLPEVL